MKFKDLKEKDDAKLGEELLELRKQMFTLRTQAVTQKLEDPSKLRKIRKDVARILTAQNQRKAAAAAPKA